MVCPSFVLGGDANTGSAGYVCLETVGLPSFFAVVSPGAATLFLGGEPDFFAALPAAFAFAALMGWPSCFVVDSPAVPVVLSGGMLCYAALSEVLRRSWVPAAMLFWAALLNGYGGYACCVKYSLEFLFGAAGSDGLFGCGEHSALHFVGDGAGGVLC